MCLCVDWGGGAPFVVAVVAAVVVVVFVDCLFACFISIFSFCLLLLLLLQLYEKDNWPFYVMIITHWLQFCFTEIQTFLFR